MLIPCDTMLGICCLVVCGCQSDDPFVCFGTKPAQRAYAQDRKWTREGRSERGQKDSQQEVPGEDSQEMRVGQRRGQSTESQKGGFWDLLTHRGRVNQREEMSALLVALWEFSLKFTLALAHRMHKKCHGISLLHLELTQVCVCIFSFLPPSWLCFTYL